MYHDNANKTVHVLIYSYMLRDMKTNLDTIFSHLPYHWVLVQHLVARCARRLAIVHLCHRELVTHNDDPHSTFDWGCRACSGPKCASWSCPSINTNYHSKPCIPSSRIFVISACFARRCRCYSLVKEKTTDQKVWVDTTLFDDAFRKYDPQDPRFAGVSRWWQTKCRGGYRARWEYDIKRQSRPGGKPPICSWVGSERRSSVRTYGL